MPSRCASSPRAPTFSHAPGLLGPHFLGIALELHVRSPADRDRMLGAIDAATEPVLRSHGGPFERIRRVGSPWLDAWLEHETQMATQRSMPLFGLFLVALVFVLYRSWRALLAIVITLAWWYPLPSDWPR